MTALSKAAMAEGLSQDVLLSKADAKSMLDVFFEEIRIRLEHGEHVKLSGFGNFILRDKSSRPGRNPKTGQPIAVTARRVVTFRAGLKLKKDIEHSRS